MARAGPKMGETDQRKSFEPCLLEKNNFIEQSTAHKALQLRYGWLRNKNVKVELMSTLPDSSVSLRQKRCPFSVSSAIALK